MKVEKLTLEQEAAIPDYIKSWIDRLDKSAKLDREAATQGAKWLYKFCKLKEPLVVFVSSPMAAQIAAGLFKNLAQVWDQVGDQVGDQVLAQVLDQVWDQVGDQVLAQVGAQVRAQVWAQVWDQVRAQVRDQVRAQVRAQVWAQVRGQELFSFCSYGSFCSDAHWIAFYRYFQKFNVCKIENDAFESFSKLIETNVYDVIQLDGAYIGCEMPIEVHRDSQHRLHSTGGMAIKWSDGWGIYSLWGVTFDKELFDKVTNRQITAKEVLTLKNIEQRMAALRFLGAESVIEAAESALLNESSKGNKLYSLSGITDQKEYALRYKCPSTGREYVSFVDPMIGAKKDADLAMAWKFNLSKEEYLSIEKES